MVIRTLLTACFAVALLAAVVFPALSPDPRIATCGVPLVLAGSRLWPGHEFPAAAGPSPRT